MPLASADIILHPVRMRMLATLAGRRLTTQQIGASLPGIPQATLYRHLSRLKSAGIIAIVEKRPVRGVVEKVYALAQDEVPINVDTSRMTSSDWQRGFAAYTTSLLGQFEAYIRQEHADPVADGVSFRTSPIYLSDFELTRFMTDLRGILIPLLSHAPSPARRRRLLSTILIPDLDIDSPSPKLPDAKETR